LKNESIFSTKYGSPEVLVFGEVLKPNHKKNEESIKVHATVVNFGECSNDFGLKITKT